MDRVISIRCQQLNHLQISSKIETKAKTPISQLANCKRLSAFMTTTWDGTTFDQLTLVIYWGRRIVELGITRSRCITTNAPYRYWRRCLERITSGQRKFYRIWVWPIFEADNTSKRLTACCMRGTCSNRRSVKTTIGQLELKRSFPH